MVPVCAVSAKRLEEEVRASVEVSVAAQLERWGSRLAEEQAGLRAKAEKALDLAELSSRACTKIAQLLQDADGAPVATLPQVEGLLQARAEELRNEWRAEATKCLDLLEVREDASRGQITPRQITPRTPRTVREDACCGQTTPRTVAAVFGDLHGRLEEWVSAIEDRICNVERALWSATRPGGAAGERGRNCSDGSNLTGPEEALTLHSVRLAIMDSKQDKLQCEVSPKAENTDAGRAEAEPIYSALGAKAYAKRLEHVELDLTGMRDEIKILAVALEVVLRDHQLLSSAVGMAPSEGSTKGSPEQIRTSCGATPEWGRTTLDSGREGGAFPCAAACTAEAIRAGCNSPQSQPLLKRGSARAAAAAATAAAVALRRVHGQ